MCTVVILWDERAHVFVVFCVLKNALLCVPCWSRWWLHPRCHMAAPGCVRHRGRAQRWSTCWCRTSPAPRSPSPPCTPSSGCQWAPGGNSVEKKYSRFVTITFYFFRSIKLTIKGLTFFLHLSACLCFCTSLCGSTHNGCFFEMQSCWNLVKHMFSFNRNWMIWKRSSQHLQD